MKTTLGQFVTQHGALRLFAEVLRGSGLETKLDARPHTLLAPTDDAFGELPAETFAALLASPSQLANLVLRHTLLGRWCVSDLLRVGSVKLLSGHLAWVENHDGLPLVTAGFQGSQSALILRTNLRAGNSVLHLLDTVL
jgi:transforming growth factor-beta-induced protein